jgi:hypothetical protein
MLFFKYQKPGSLEFTMLRRGEVYFASPSELNDAHECRPRMVLNGSNELWQRLADFVLERVCSLSGYYSQSSSEDMHKLLGLAEPVGQTLKKRAQNRDIEFVNLGQIFVEVLLPYLDKLLQPPLSRQISHWIRRYIDIELPRQLAEEPYIASFSLSATNPTMWGHYAGAEKGFVLVFASSDQSIHVRSQLRILHGTRPSKRLIGAKEIGIYKDERLELKHVKYGTKPPKVNAFYQLIQKFRYTDMEDHYDVPLLLPGDAAKKQENMLGLVKYSDWRYEKEVRAFFPTFGPLPPDVRALRIASKNIIGLIFGQKMSPSDKNRAIICCHLMRELQDDGHTEDFVFFQAEQHPVKFNLEIRPVGILEGRYFGTSMPMKPVEALPMTKAQKITEIAKEICSSRRALK